MSKLKICSKKKTKNRWLEVFLVELKGGEGREECLCDAPQVFSQNKQFSMIQPHNPIDVILP